MGCNAGVRTNNVAFPPPANRASEDNIVPSLLNDCVEFRITEEVRRTSHIVSAAHNGRRRRRRLVRCVLLFLLSGRRKDTSALPFLFACGHSSIRRVIGFFYHLIKWQISKFRNIQSKQINERWSSLPIR